MADVVQLPKKEAETHVDARARTLRMAASWADLGKRLASQAAAAVDEKEQRRLAEECLAQLSMTRDIVASVVGALPEKDTPRSVLAQMAEIMRSSGELEKQRHSIMLGDLRTVLQTQMDALAMLHSEMGKGKKP